MLARVGQFCYRRRRWVILVWLAMFVIGLGIGSQVIERFDNDNIAAQHESIAAERQLESGSPYGSEIAAIVTGVDFEDPTVAARIHDAVADIGDRSDVSRAVDPFSANRHVTGDANGHRVTADGTAALITINLTPRISQHDEDIAYTAITDQLRAIPQRIGDGTVTLGGALVAQHEIDEQTDKDTKLGEAIALPITLVVMVFLFGGVLAASIPILAALAAIAGGLLSLYAASYFTSLDAVALSTASVLGLGLAIDYTLLMVSRFKEERAATSDVAVAVRTTVRTAGRTVVFSGLTVASSLCGLFLFPSPLFRALGIAGLSVVVLSIVIATTLTPALLGAFAGRIAPRKPPTADAGFFAATARWARRLAIPVLIVITGLLLLAGTPFLRAEYFNGRAELLPAHMDSHHFDDLVDDHFSQAGAAPVVCVMKANSKAAATWVRSVKAWPQVQSAGTIDVQGKYAVVSLYAKNDAEALDLVQRLRDERPQFRLWVTGEAAVSLDFRAEVAQRAPWALAVVGTATFILLFLMTGSVLVPIKALIMNLLSLGASFGALVWIFQDGTFSSFLGFDSTGTIETYIPVLVFAFAFGLSMDYEVFLLSRVKELYDHGYDNNRAVQIGLQRSGRIITAAALLMIIVFLGFVAGRMLGVKQLGVALAIAVAVDATLIRCLLVPATMTLLGRANWWAPKPLRWLHGKIGLHEVPQLAAIPTAVGIAKAPWAALAVGGVVSVTPTPPVIQAAAPVDAQPTVFAGLAHGVSVVGRASVPAPRKPPAIGRAQVVAQPKLADLIVPVIPSWRPPR